MILLDKLAEIRALTETTTSWCRHPECEHGRTACPRCWPEEWTEAACTKHNLCTDELLRVTPKLLEALKIAYRHLEIAHHSRDCGGGRTAMNFQPERCDCGVVATLRRIEAILEAEDK